MYDDELKSQVIICHVFCYIIDMFTTFITCGRFSNKKAEITYLPSAQDYTQRCRGRFKWDFDISELLPHESAYLKKAIDLTF